MASYLLDTTAIIDHLRGDKKVSSYLINIAKRGDLCGCCCINVAETYNAMKGKKKRKQRNLLKAFIIMR